jgi:hypothetical protein
MKYKIQTAAYSGWADLKSSDDSDMYTILLFDTLAEAQAELADLASCDGVESDWRIVTEDMPADCDIYECEGWSVA